VSDTCKRCSECEGCEHHWIDADELHYDFDCKHCDAVGMRCQACDGDGDGDADSLTACKACGGCGVVEAKRITQ